MDQDQKRRDERRGAKARVKELQDQGVVPEIICQLTDEVKEKCRQMEERTPLPIPEDEED